ncbi:MAG: minichromosome maintenance protein MCM [Promethearchaeota archaeon]
MVIDVSLPPADPTKNFEEFFREFEDEPNHFKYREMIQNAAYMKENSITILFEDLLSFDPPLADFLKNEPEVALKYAVESFKDLLMMYSGGQIDDIDYFVRVTTRNQSNEVLLRKLRSEHIDKLVYIHGILIRASQVIPQITIATFECPVCQTQMEIEQLESNVLITPRKCANPNCKNKRNFQVVSKESKFIDWQSIRIQELPEELEPGRVPFWVKGILTHDLVDKARPGDRVKIMGIYKIHPNEIKQGRKTTLFTPYIKVLSVEGRSNEEDDIDITPQDIVEIKKWAKKKDIQKIIARSLVPGIIGNEHLKLAAALALFGGVRKEFKGQNPIRGDIHVLFMGDPGTGKSHILKQCFAAAPRAVYTSGRGSSAAGLTAGIVKDSDSGGLSLEAGALVLADEGVAVIDEFDKMERNDRSAIHEAMEQQTVSIAKAGIIATLRAQTTVIAAANPKEGRWDDDQSPSDNINLPPTILSRFDLTFIVRDKVDELKDAELAQFILKRHSGMISKEQNQENLIPFDLLKKYIKYARPLKPQLTDEAIEEIKNFYVEIRTENKRRKIEGGDSAVPIVARSLEGFVRVSEAYAKMELSPYVTREHVKEALKLARKSIEDTSRDPLTGEMNVDRLITGMTATKKKIFKILDFLKKKMEESNLKSLDKEEFIDDVELEFEMDRSKIEELLEKLIQKGIIFEPRNGLIALSKKSKSKSI